MALSFEIINNPPGSEAKKNLDVLFCISRSSLYPSVATASKFHVVQTEVNCIQFISWDCVCDAYICKEGAYAKMFKFIY